jgi:hypothetical protein
MDSDVSNFSASNPHCVISVTGILVGFSVPAVPCGKIFRKMGNTVKVISQFIKVSKEESKLSQRGDQHCNFWGPNFTEV